MNNQNLQKKVRTSLTTILALAVVLFLPYLAIKTYFADSEIWSINLGYNFPDEVRNYWVFSRALFYTLVFSATRFFDDPVNIFLAARMLMMMNVVAQILLLYHLVNHYLRNRFANWLVILLMVGNTFYLTQSYRIRSDLLATTVLLAVLLAFAKIKKPIQRLFILLLGCGLTLLSTPKSIFVLPIIGLTYIWDQKDPKKWFHLLGLIGGTLLLYICSLYLRLGVLSDLALDLSLYLKNSLLGVESGIPYFSKRSFLYVQKLFFENPWLAIVWFLPFLNLRSRDARKWIGIHSFLIILLFVAPEKLPFFICSLLPLLSLSSILSVQPLFTQGLFMRQSSLALAGLATLIFISSAWKIMHFIHEDTNKEQISAMRALNSYLDRFPEIKYYDVIGISPSHSRLRHFAGPNQPATNRVVADIIINEKPDLLLRVAKLDYLGVKILQFLEKDYIHVGNGFYLRSFDLPTHLQSENGFFSIKRKVDLEFLSPLFKKYKGTDYIFETRGPKGERTVFTSVQNFFNNKPASSVTIVKVSPFPAPDSLPPRNLHQLFRFDSEF